MIERTLMQTQIVKYCMYTLTFQPFNQPVSLFTATANKIKEVIIRIGKPAIPALQAAALSQNPTFAAEADSLIKSIYLSGKLQDGTLTGLQNTTADAED